MVERDDRREPFEESDDLELGELRQLDVDAMIAEPTGELTELISIIRDSPLLTPEAMNDALELARSAILPLEDQIQMGGPGTEDFIHLMEMVVTSLQRRQEMRATSEN